MVCMVDQTPKLANMSVLFFDGLFAVWGYAK